MGSENCFNKRQRTFISVYRFFPSLACHDPFVIVMTIDRSKTQLFFLLFLTFFYKCRIYFISRLQSSCCMQLKSYIQLSFGDYNKVRTENTRDWKWLDPVEYTTNKMFGDWHLLYTDLCLHFHISSVRSDTEKVMMVVWDRLNCQLISIHRIVCVLDIGQIRKYHLLNLSGSEWEVIC